MPSAAPRAVQLYGIISLDVSGTSSPVRGVNLISFRELGALVTDTTYAAPSPTTQHVAEYRRVVEGAFARQTVVPAPFGSVFRSRDALMRWLELHYFTLNEAVTFVSDRAMARVSVSYGEEPENTAAMSVDADLLDTTADESFRLLRRHAVASLVMSHHAGGGAPAARASFLIERERWDMFNDIVREEQKRLREMQVECTGPWPPYDFVRMQFGA
ncbi:MAG TPA: GvpL/GvpF family gas vesicle protein [Gemmatimonadaceae bacterium]|nr:GvpL/GvpF family gas vesicle protein [Gemmatimonadaceae bacterium]